MQERDDNRRDNPEKYMGKNVYKCLNIKIKINMCVILYYEYKAIGMINQMFKKNPMF